jgi:hypothetical protein
MEQQPPLSDPGFLVTLLIAVPIWFAMIWAYVRIVQKAGYSGWNVLWGFVPLVNIIMFFVFAFSEWPVTRRIKELEHRVFGDAPEPKLGA